MEQFWLHVHMTKKSAITDMNIQNEDFKAPEKLVSYC